MILIKLLIIFSIFFSHSVISADLISDDKESKIYSTIIAQGVGKDIDSALKNAAENGLMQVVGTFIKSKKQLEKRSTIIDGVRNEIKSLSSTINEYSQGTIKHFETLDVNQSDGLIIVSAKIIVRIDDFHAYIKKLAEGEVAVNEGLFVKMATEKKQNENLSSIIAEVIKPIASGEVTEFKIISEPKSITEIKDELKYAVKGISNITGNGNLIWFDVEARLSESFKLNMFKTFESTAIKTTRYNSGLNVEMSFSNSQNGKTVFQNNQENSYDYLNDSIILLTDGELNFPNIYPARRSSPQMIFSAYLFKNVQKELMNKLNFTFYNLPSNTLVASMLDEKNMVLQKEQNGNVNSNRLFAFNSTFNDMGAKYGREGFMNQWSLLGLASSGGGNSRLMIWEKRVFTVIISVNDNILSRIKKIKLELID